VTLFKRSPEDVKDKSSKPANSTMHRAVPSYSIIEIDPSKPISRTDPTNKKKKEKLHPMLAHSM